MRAKEFIGETKLSKSAHGAVPGLQKYDALDNSSPYHAYRFGVALAGMPDYPMDLEGPTGQKMVTVGYTKADDAILKATGKHLGFQGIIVTPKGSKELDDTNAQSPTADWNPRNKKKKKQ
jgi:hypothetical protein